MQKITIVILSVMFVVLAMLSSAGAGFMSEMGNMVKEDAKQAATQEGKKVVDKAVEQVVPDTKVPGFGDRAKGLNATAKDAAGVSEKLQKAQEMKTNAEETKHNMEKMHEMGTHEMKKWKNMYHHDEK